MWIVSTDEFDSTTQEFDDERSALAGFAEFIEERDIAGDNYRVYLAKVVKSDGGPAAWKRSWPRLTSARDNPVKAGISRKAAPLKLQSVTYGRPVYIDAL